MNAAPLPSTREVISYATTKWRLLARTRERKDEIDLAY